VKTFEKPLYGKHSEKQIAEEIWDRKEYGVLEQESEQDPDLSQLELVDDDAWYSHYYDL
jgi:hypothetical protein